MLLDLRGMLLDLFECFSIPAAVSSGHHPAAWQQDAVGWQPFSSRLQATAGQGTVNT